MLSDDPGVTRIEVQLEASVVSTLAWSAMTTQGLDAAGRLHVASHRGAERQTVLIDTDITGGSVTVTAWALPRGAN